MSENYVEVVEITHVKPHPDADLLDIAIVFGRITCVVGRDQYKIGDKAVYFPADMLIPERVAIELGVAKYLKYAVYPQDIAKSACRIAACRLRGQPSYGFLVPIGECFFGGDSPAIGTDVSATFNAVKYVPVARLCGDAAREYDAFHHYTNIEHWYRHPELIPSNEPVRITEKIHGTNSRVGLIKVGDEYQFMAGSHRVNRKKPEGDGRSIYWEPLEHDTMLNLLTDLCNGRHDVIAFGEIYGTGVQDMDYGVERGYRLFDISIDGEYLSWDTVAAKCAEHGVATVPLLYSGPFSPEILEQYTHGETTLGKPRCKFKGREGVVVTRLTEGRVRGKRCIVKSVSADYLGRKDAEDNGEL